jgi:3-oxoacyl-[acyl-carrier-protein] synthase-1
MMNQDVVIAGLGMLTPVGLDAPMTASSFRAGISRVSECPIIDDRLEPVYMGCLAEDVLPEPSPEMRNMSGLRRRLLRLAAMPLLEALGPDTTPGPVRLFLAGPRAPTGSAPWFDDAFLAELGSYAGVDIAPESATFPLGRAGFFVGLQEALAAVLASDTRGTEPVIVGGVDSCLDPMRLARLQQENRLLREGVVDGFRPGEGAGFILLAREAVARQDGRVPLVRIAGVGLGKEEGHRYSDKPYRGEGLAAAFSSMFGQAGLQAEVIKTVFAGLNGESFNAKEWGVAHLRNSASFAQELQFEHPAEYIGDAGAALAPVMMGAAALGMHEEYLAGPTVVWSSSDEEERGSACLTPMSTDSI